MYRAFRPFSILGRIGGDATGPGRGPGVSGIRAFSILGRIGGDATSRSLTGSSSAKNLSVSSVGSEAMQLLGEVDLLCDGKALSVSSVGSEAMQPAHVRIPRQEKVRLSVSSVGSEAMQHGSSAMFISAEVTNFQYPRSDRRRCNDVRQDSSPAPLVQLSVSSVGSEAMQLRSSGRM